MAAKADAGARPLIIKKKKIIAGGHHGGAWKVAYADFVTAMMAFFLLMWLLNVTTKEQKEGIGDFFAPTMAMPTGVMESNPDVMSGSRSILESKPSSPPNPNEDQESDDVEDPGKQSPSRAEGTQDEAPGEGRREVSEDDIDKALTEREDKAFDEAKKQIQQAMQGQPEFKDLINNLKIDNTPEGLRIQLIDKEGRPLFQSGNSKMDEKTRALLSLVAKSVADLPNQLAISGHTDAHPYAGRGDFDNWDLSAARANASRRALVDAGLDSTRINRVVGKGDGEPIQPEDPYAPENRRISIVLLRTNLTSPDGGGSSGDSGAVPAGKPVRATRGGPGAPPPARPAPQPDISPAPVPIPD